MGYLLKGATKEEILRAVTAVASGEAIFGPSIARRLQAQLSTSYSDPFPELTPREREVLRWLATGQSNSGIAEQLGLSVKTVNNLTSSVITKLRVTSRTEAALQARDPGRGQEP
jgi:DNA-binding NarL/FixJ family response regulator